MFGGSAGDDEVADVEDERGNAIRLFKFIFRLPVGGGTYFGGSFQPGGAEIEEFLMIL